jgi:hypothetical protein
MNSPNGTPLPSFASLRNHAWTLQRINPGMRRCHIYESIAQSYGYRVYAAMHVDMLTIAQRVFAEVR